MEPLLTKVMSILFLPFVFYVLWGPFAFFFASRSLVRRLRMRRGPLAAAARAFVMLAIAFLPVVAAEPVGDAIPVVLPWWVALLGSWLGSGLEFSEGSLVVAIFFIAAAACVTIFQAFGRGATHDG